MTPSAKLLITFLLVAGLATASDPALLNLIMPDATVVIGIQVDRIKSSPIGQSLFSQLEPSEIGLKTWIDATGFDPRRDLAEVLIAAPTEKDRTRGLVLLRGSFDPARLMNLAKLAEAQITTYQGIQIVSGKEQEALALACLDQSIAAAGDPQSVRAAIARRGFSSRLDPKLQAKVSELSGALDIWGVAIMPVSDLAKEVPDPKISGMLGDALKSIEQISGGVQFGSKLQLSLELGTRSPKDAAALRDVLRLLIGLALTQGKPQSQKALENLQVKAEANSVKFSLEISQQEVAKMIEAQKKVMAARRQQQQQPKSTDVIIHTTPREAGLTAPPSEKETGVVTLPVPK